MTVDDINDEVVKYFITNFIKAAGILYDSAADHNEPFIMIANMGSGKIIKVQIDVEKEELT